MEDGADEGDVRPQHLLPVRPNLALLRGRAVTEGSGTVAHADVAGSTTTAATTRSPGSPLLAGFRALVRTTAEAVSSEALGANERHDRHDRLSLGGW